tara:strand:- start:2951 stop:3133 length:183 start_codon:yes stop_codon:yes gene_type:complete
MDWDIENENLKLENMIIIYEQEIKKLEIENETLLEEVRFLKLQLDYKTLGMPSEVEDDDE